MQQKVLAQKTRNKKTKIQNFQEFLFQYGFEIFRELHEFRNLYENSVIKTHEKMSHTLMKK